MGGAWAWALELPPGAARRWNRGAEGKRRDCTTLPRWPPPPPPQPAEHRRRTGGRRPCTPPPGEGTPPPLPPGGTAAPGAERHRANRPARSVPAVTSARCGAGQPTGLPARHPPVHKGAPRRPPRTAPRRERTDTNQCSMETTPSIDRATPTKTALVLVLGRQRDGPRQRCPPPPAPQTPQPIWTQPRPQGGRQLDRPPPLYPPGAGPPRAQRPAHEATPQSKARGRRDRATPPRAN